MLLSNKNGCPKLIWILLAFAALSVAITSRRQKSIHQNNNVFTNTEKAEPYGVQHNGAATNTEKAEPYGVANLPLAYRSEEYMEVLTSLDRTMTDQKSLPAQKLTAISDSQQQKQQTHVNSHTKIGVHQQSEVSIYSTTFADQLSPVTIHSTATTDQLSPVTIHSTASADQLSPATIHSTTTTDQLSPVTIHSTTTTDQLSPVTIHSTTTTDQLSPVTIHSTTTEQLSHATIHSTTSADQLSPVTIHSTTTDQLSPATLHSTASADQLSPATIHSTTSADQLSPVTIHSTTTDQLSPVTIHSVTYTSQRLQTREFTSSIDNILYYQENIYKPGSRQQTNNSVKTSTSVWRPQKSNLFFHSWSATDEPFRTKMDRSRCSFTDNGTTANCSFLNLTEVPHDGISYMILRFDLYNNSISKLTNFTFKNYTRLESLDLSNNKISELEDLAFSGLEQLKVLNLWNNRLKMTDTTFPENIFSSLTHLEELRINRNNPDCKNSTGLNYPDQALSRLTSLTTLYLDGLANQDFGPGFQNLTKLVSLIISGYRIGYCQMYALENTTFQYLSQLQHLNLSDCFIIGYKIHVDSFSTLRNLISLDLTHNEDIDIQNVDNVFYGLRNTTSLKRLSMNLIVNRYSIGICLDSYYIRNFPQHLEHFYAQENNIEGLDRHILGKLSPSLKTLDVSGNKFVFGTYLADLHLMRNLTYLRLNGEETIYELPKRYPFLLTSRHTSPLNCTLYAGRDGRLDGYAPFILQLPPNLKSVEMNHAGLTYTLSRLIVDTKNTLQNLSMKGNRFPELIGPFVGLHSLKYLDLSGSYVQYISDKFFKHLTSLETLKLSDNSLGDFFFTETDARVFLPLTNLTFLDLSFNDIRNFSTNVFAGLNNLQTLLLDRNSLTEFAVNISHMNYLISVNLSRNRISKLPDDLRKHVDFLLDQGQALKIDMSQCPVSCNCENLDFLLWIKESVAFGKDFKGYLCVYEDDTSKLVTDGYNNTVEVLRRQCSSKKLLFLIVAAAMLLIFCVILFTILYRFRWKLRYLYYAAHLFYTSTNRDRQSTEFEYDAFISYDQEDEHFVVGKLSRELEKRGLRLCIHGRDFVAGEYIASNIVRAVCASRRTVVVLTEHLLTSYWCRFEIQMANMEAVHTDRKVLLFLLMGTIPQNSLGKELLYHIRNNTYIPYPDPIPDATSLGRLWDKLTADIRD